MRHLATSGLPTISRHKRVESQPLRLISKDADIDAFQDFSMTSSPPDYTVQPKTFADRAALIAHVAALSPREEPVAAGMLTGNSAAAAQRLADLDPVAYARGRNFLDGPVTMLSPYIRHGMVSLNAARNIALSRVRRPDEAEKFIQELAWRDYWQRVARRHPEWLWQDIEPYKTGFMARDYAADLPEDIHAGETGVAAIDGLIALLKREGYLHNHGRMYLAAYIVHWRRVSWQAGARFMLRHLVDGDTASNNFSWQWVASTFSRKPYIFNLENMRKYCGGLINTDDRHNMPLAAGYDVLTLRLFPDMEPM